MMFFLKNIGSSSKFLFPPLPPSSPEGRTGDRDKVLLSEFITYLDSGTIEKASTRPNGVVYIVYKYSKISDNIIPFFDKYPLQGTKFLDYKDFCIIADLIREKSHLTVEGLNEIRLIRAGMNSGRNNI